jgi:hypothetical protein
MDGIKMRIKTLDNVVAKMAIILALVSLSSFCVLTYLFSFDRVKLLVELLYLFPLGLPYLVSLGPITMGLLLSIDYTSFGLIWEGWLVVPMNSTLRLTLTLALFASLTGILPLVPLTLFTPLSKVSGYETLGDAIQGFKSLIWSTKDGKRIVVSRLIGSATMYMLTLFTLLSIYTIIPLGSVPTMTIGLFLGIAVFITVLFIMPRYRRLLNQKLQIK